MMSLSKHLRSLRTKALRWWARYFIPAEFAAAIVVAMAFATWDLIFRGSRVINGQLEGNRAAIYSTLATIFGSLFGFAVATLAIVIVFASDDRMKIIREGRSYKMMYDVFASAIKALSVATLFSLFGLVFDRDRITGNWAGPNQPLFSAVLFLLVLSFLRLARCIWVLQKLVGIATLPSNGNR